MQTRNNERRIYVVEAEETSTTFDNMRFDTW